MDAVVRPSRVYNTPAFEVIDESWTAYANRKNIS
jgi:hypothetical protein